MFAIDGVKLPCNASNHRSGTRAGFTQRAEKLEQAAQTIRDQHPASDALEFEPDAACQRSTLSGRASPSRARGVAVRFGATEHSLRLTRHLTVAAL